MIQDLGSANGTWLGKASRVGKAMEKGGDIPAHRLEPRSAVWGDNPPGARTDGNFIWHKSLSGYYGAGIIGPVMGMAEGGLEAYKEITSRRFGIATRAQWQTAAKCKFG